VSFGATRKQKLFFGFKCLEFNACNELFLIALPANALTLDVAKTLIYQGFFNFNL
jgi:hypothetical protein